MFSLALATNSALFTPFNHDSASIMTWLLSRSLVVLVGLQLTVWVCWGEAAPIQHKSEQGEDVQDGSTALPHGHAGEEKVADYAVSTLRYVNTINSGDPDL